MKLTKNLVFLHYFSKFMGISLFVLEYMCISLLLKMINGFSWPGKIMASPFNKERLKVYRTLFKNITRDWLYLIHFVGVQHWTQRMGITVAGGLQGWRHTAWWGRGWWSWSWRSVRLAHKQQKQQKNMEGTAAPLHVYPQNGKKGRFPFNFLGKHTHTHNL